MKKKIQRHHRKQEVANAKSSPINTHPTFPSTRPPTRGPVHTVTAGTHLGVLGTPGVKCIYPLALTGRVRIYSALFSCPFSSRVITFTTPHFSISRRCPPRLRFPCSCSSPLPSPQALTPRSLPHRGFLFEALLGLESGPPSTLSMAPEAAVLQR